MRFTQAVGLSVLLLCSGSSCGGSSASNANSLAGAAITAAIAATVWVAAGGCRLQGCPWGSFCDKKEGRCEVRSCTDGCPQHSYCNESIDRCEDMPSVTRMNPPPYQPPDHNTSLQPADPNWQQPTLPRIPF